MSDQNALIKSLYKRELGKIQAKEFISPIHRRSLKTFGINRYYSNPESTNSSITWFSLENIDYKYLLAAKSNGHLICIDLSKENEENLNEFVFAFNEIQAHKFSISCVQWYPFDTGMFFTSGMDKCLKVWDANNVTAVEEYKYDEKIFSHHMSPVASSNCKNLIAIGFRNGNIGFADLNSGSSTHILKEHSKDSCVGVQWSPIDPNILCSAGYDGKIFLWDIRSSRSLLTCFDHKRSSDSRKRKLYENNKNESKAVAHAAPILGFTFIQGGNYLISTAKDNHIRSWNVMHGTNTLVNYGKTISSSIHHDANLQIGSIELNGSSYVLIPNGRTLNIYDVSEGVFIKTCKGHFDSINCCVYHPIFNQVFTGSKDRNILTWAAAYNTTVR